MLIVNMSAYTQYEIAKNLRNPNFFFVFACPCDFIIPFAPALPEEDQRKTPDDCFCRCPCDFIIRVCPDIFSCIQVLDLDYHHSFMQARALRSYPVHINTRNEVNARIL